MCRLHYLQIHQMKCQNPTGSITGGESRFGWGSFKSRNDGALLQVSGKSVTLSLRFPSFSVSARDFCCCSANDPLHSHRKSLSFRVSRDLRTQSSVCPAWWSDHSCWLSWLSPTQSLEAGPATPTAYPLAVMQLPRQVRLHQFLVWTATGLETSYQPVISEQITDSNTLQNESSIVGIGVNQEGKRNVLGRP